MNIVERPMLLCRGSEILPEDLPQAMGRQNLSAGAYKRPAPFFDAAGDIPDEWLEKPFREVRKDVIAKLEHRYLEAQPQRAEAASAKRPGFRALSLDPCMKR